MLAEVRRQLDAVAAMVAARNPPTAVAPRPPVGSTPGTRARQRSAPVAVEHEPDPRELYAKIEALLRDRPHTLRELLEATGARRNRVSGGITHLKTRYGTALKNLGTARRAQWFIQEDKRNR